MRAVIKQVHMWVDNRLELVGQVWQEGRGWFWRGENHSGRYSHGPHSSDRAAAASLRRAARKANEVSPS